MEKFVVSSLARRAAAASTQGSATALTSVNSDSAQNSRGASTNLAEISQTLDSLLDKLTESERLSIGEENVAKRLQRLCEQYPQSCAPTHLPEWQRDQETFRMICIAADCAESVYARKQQSGLPGISLPSSDYQPVQEIAATAAGDFKATTIRVHQRSRTLVVAVKGTKKTSPIDWITNANGEPTDAKAFLPNLEGVKAYGGFLYVAQSMAPIILCAIQSYSEPLDRVCFTGHSAGGAVAQLLCLHYCLSQSLEIPVDCITFAAPPVLSIPNIFSTRVNTAESFPDLKTRFITLVAHGDPVPRADRPFIRQLLQIYSSASDVPDVVNLRLDPQELFHVGALVVLFDKNPDGDDEEIVAVEAEAGLGEFLWGNVKMHDMKVYLQMLSNLQD